jgi:hypothetical protein
MANRRRTAAIVLPASLDSKGRLPRGRFFYQSVTGRSSCKQAKWKGEDVTAARYCR